MWRVGVDCFRKMEEVIDGLNNMCTVVGDIISSVAWVAGYGDARLILEVIDMYWDSEAFRLPLVSSGVYIQI